MKKILMLLATAGLSLLSVAQIPLTVLPSGGNKKASVSERIGLTDVTIHYDHEGGLKGFAVEETRGDFVPDEGVREV